MSASHPCSEAKEEIICRHVWFIDTSGSLDVRLSVEFRLADEITQT